MLRHSVLAIIIALAITVCALGSASAAEFGLQLLAETSLPGDLEVDGILVGGLSGLTYDPGCDLYYVVSDDRGRYGPPRFVTLTVSRAGNAATVEILEATTLRNLEGGLLARGEVDPEALVLGPDGMLLISSEGAPHRGVQPLIARFTLDGRMLGGIPLPERYLSSADGARGVRDNLAFEGLALAPAGDRLFAIVENALIQDGPAADLGQGRFGAKALAIGPIGSEGIVGVHDGNQLGGQWNGIAGEATRRLIELATERPDRNIRLAIIVYPATETQ